MKLGIFGRGRLGSAVARLAETEPDLDLLWSLGRDGKPGAKVELALDASSGVAVPGHLEWARATGTNLVIGTTGWDRTLLEGYREWPIGVLVAPNFSLSLAFLRRVACFIGRLAALDLAADLAILERHHRAKLDSPSGTAKLLAEALVEACPRYAAASPAASTAALPIASIRAGSEIGYHEIRFEAEHETIVVSHEAKSRDLFAQGAVRALRWLAGKKGVFSFDDVAEELLSPLFLSRGDPARKS